VRRGESHHAPSEIVILFIKIFHHSRKRGEATINSSSFTFFFRHVKVSGNQQEKFSLPLGFTPRKTSSNNENCEKPVSKEPQRTTAINKK